VEDIKSNGSKDPPVYNCHGDDKYHHCQPLMLLSMGQGVPVLKALWKGFQDVFFQKLLNYSIMETLEGAASLEHW